MTLSASKLLKVNEATWPPAKSWISGVWRLRDGQGGGKRVSAATLERDLREGDVAQAEEEMRQQGQSPLFMIREGDEALDDELARSGYDIFDPTNIYIAPVELLTDQPIPPVTIFTVWEPLAIMVDIWGRSGIGPERLAVMRRAAQKTGLFSRWNEKPGGVGFVALEGDVAMVHALEVLPHQQRQGVAQWMMRGAAFWAAQHGAQYLSCLCVADNVAANQLYRKLGFQSVGRYHYRQKEI